MTPAKVVKAAEQFILRYFETTKHIKLTRHQDGEKRFDFRNQDSSLFAQVKGNSKQKLSEGSPHYFTNVEYLMAKNCQAKNLEYEILSVLGIGTSNRLHYVIPANLFS
jgi:hypothetical protein